MGRRIYSFLFLIIFLGASLRFAFLSDMPPSLNWDEVSHGYNAYSVLKTGMDQWGQKFPLLNFRAYGDYPTTLNLYLTILFILIFGLTDFAIRFPHALLGTLTLISIFFLTYGVTKNRAASLFAAFLAAIGPWYVFTSRFVLQSNLAIFLVISSAALFVNRGKNKRFIMVSYFLLLLTLFSYHTTRIFSPIILLGTVIIYKNEIKNKYIYIFAVAFISLASFILLNPNSRARAKYLSIFDQGAINKIEEGQNKYGHIIVNKGTYFVYKFGTNYISYFSPKFLFLKGGTQYQFSIPNTGLIYLINLPLFYIGLYLLIKKSFKDKNYRFLTLWLILAPIPASLTNESFAVIRATTMLPIPEILIALAGFELMSKFKKNYVQILIPLYFLILVFSLENYATNYIKNYRIGYSESWQYGYKQVVSYANQNYQNYDKIIVTKKYGEPHEYFLYYSKYDPGNYLNDFHKITFYQSGWWWVDRFDKYYFVNDWQVKDLITESWVKIDCIKVKCLLITSPNNSPDGWSKLETVNFLDGQPAFEIYENF